MENESLMSPSYGHHGPANANEDDNHGETQSTPESTSKRIHEGDVRRARGNESSKERNKKKIHRMSYPPSTRLYRSGYVLFLATLYTGLVLFAWAVTCVQTYRPIAAPLDHYGM